MSNSLNQGKTLANIFTEILMMATTFKGTHFLLEGDDDCKFWRHHLNLENVSLVNCGGKTNLIGAANKILQTPIAAVAGVYDADFDRLRSIEPHAPTLLAATDANDLEITLLLSEALKRVLDEWTDPALVDTFETTHNISVIDYLEKIATEFGRLRFLNLEANHKVDFKKLSPYRFVSIDDWSFDLLGLRQEYAAQASISLEVLESELQSHCPSAPAWSYAQGHDTLCILAQGLRKTIGKIQMDEKALIKDLRLAFSLTLLQKTAMYASLRKIEVGLPLPLFS